MSASEELAKSNFLLMSLHLGLPADVERLQIVGVLGREKGVCRWSISSTASQIMASLQRYHE